MCLVGGEHMTGKKSLGTAMLVVVTAGFFTYLTRPLSHELFMLLYRFPPLWESLIPAAAVALAIWLNSKGDPSGFDFETAMWAGMLTYAVCFVITAPLGIMYPQDYLAHTLQISQISDLPNVDPSTVRILPLSVAHRYAEDALQYQRYKLGEGDIAFINGTPSWVFGLVPDGLINTFILQDKGAIYVDMSSSSKNTQIIEETMKIGEGMAVTDWYLWTLYKNRYWVDYGDPYFVPAPNGGLYIAVPVISYEYRWRFPTLFTVPKWDGVALIHSDGKVEFLTPEEARRHPALQGQKLFPEGLARYYVESFRYVHGIINKLFYHRDELEIADVPGQGNQQPFLVATERGLKWFVACEPYGKAYGIYRIYLIDARTGEIEYFEPAKDEVLIGPAKAGDYVRRENPMIDWNVMEPVEPIPVVVEGHLYWEIRVVPKDSSGVAYTAMVNAKTSEVLELKSDEAVKAFIAGKLLEASASVEEAETSESTVAVIVIREGDKIVRKIGVQENQTVEIIPSHLSPRNLSFGGEKR